MGGGRGRNLNHLNKRQLLIRFHTVKLTWDDPEGNINNTLAQLLTIRLRGPLHMTTQVVLSQVLPAPAGGRD